MSSSKYGATQTWRFSVSSGSSSNAHGVWFACLRSRFMRMCTQSEPFSMLATRSVGCRVNTRCAIMLPIVSWIARSDTRSLASGSTGRKGSKYAGPPHATPTMAS